MWERGACVGGGAQWPNGHGGGGRARPRNQSIPYDRGGGGGGSRRGLAPPCGRGRWRGARLPPTDVTPDRQQVVTVIGVALRRGVGGSATALPIGRHRCARSWPLPPPPRAGLSATPGPAAAAAFVHPVFHSLGRRPPDRAGDWGFHLTCHDWANARRALLPTGTTVHHVAGGGLGPSASHSSAL